MTNENLHRIANQMVESGKGILAADESTGTAGKRLSKVNLENTEENRRRYRELFLTTEGVEEGLSGVILFRETLYQEDSEGKPFLNILKEKGILPGVKVDRGKVPLPNFPDELVTQGLDNLDDRLDEYADRGATFTKWRAVIRIGEHTPTDQLLKANAHVMMRYAAHSQKAGLVPIVEPEVLIDGDHDIDTAEQVTTQTLQVMFDELNEYNVDLKGTILKSSMVLPGNDCPDQSNPDAIAEATLRTFKNSVPEEIPGIVFLSGGQSAKQATENLNAVNKQDGFPWEISFSFGRALQGPSLEAWQGKEENVEQAQRIFQDRVKATSAAREGSYSPDMEDL